MSDRINWQRMRFKKNKVWVAVDDEEKPIVKNGKYLIKYQLGQDYEYWVHRNSVRPIDKPQTDSQTPPSASPIVFLTAFDICFFALSGTEPFENVQHAPGPYSTESAFSARLILGKLQEIACDINHAV